MILQADKNAIIAATLVRNEIKTGLERANNLLFYGFFHICQAEIFALAV
jgi:argonaute-like protein implicated in RNA metabolism and viral defense